MIKLHRKYETEIGVMAMVMLVAGTFADPDSLTQKMLFLLPGPMLAYTAYISHQKMLFCLQAVVTLGVILSFYPQTPTPFNYEVVLVTGLIAVGYLIGIKYIKDDNYWPIAALGILLLALGYSTNAAKEPITFNTLLASGSLLVAIYSYIWYHILKIRVAGIWFILNVLFAINPTFIILTKLFF